MTTPARDRFITLVRDAVTKGMLVKLTLAKYRGDDRSLQNLFIRPVQLKAGPHLSFVWRFATRDITKNHLAEDALTQLETLVGRDFLDAHLFTPTASAQLEIAPNGSARLRMRKAPTLSPPEPQNSHNRTKTHLISPTASWLRALGITNDGGQPREGMSDKYRQIQKFAEVIAHLLAESFSSSMEPFGSADRTTLNENPPLRIVDIGAGKGYLTFAVASLLRDRARVVGVEARSELVNFCNHVAHAENFSGFLEFVAGTIESTDLKSIDVLIALHACDTATDDGLAKGVAAGAKLLVVSPCCQKELRRQIVAPSVLENAFQHGIFQERQAEFVTDALRAQLLEWAGYRTRVFEFVSTEHTAKNLMITAVKSFAAPRNELAASIRDFAAFYGIRSQRLAQHLGFDLVGKSTEPSAKHP